MRQENAPGEHPALVGVFDSGVGGLSVMRSCISRLPSHDLIYIADTAHCPYGSRSPEEILSYSEGITRCLIAAGARIIVVACNTASAVALVSLRRSFPQVPFVGIVPAVKPAAEQTRTGIVGVLATPTTLKGQLYRDVVEHYALGVQVISRPGHGLVEQVEAGDLDGPQTMRLLHECVDPLIAAGADTLVLGCTHYPFLVPALRQIIGPQILLVEPSEAVARQTASVLHRSGLLDARPLRGRVHFCSTGDADRFEVILRCLLPSTAPVRQLSWNQGHLRDEPRGAVAS